MFARWGRFVYRFRWATLVASGVVLGISIGGLLMGGTLTSGGPPTGDLEAVRAGNLVSKELGSGTSTTSNFVLIFSSPTLSVGDQAFKDGVNSALAPIQSDPRIAQITDPYNASDPRIAQAFTSKDGHEALVSIDIKSTGTQAHDDYASLRAKIHSDTLAITSTGFVPINIAFNATL